MNSEITREMLKQGFNYFKLEKGKYVEYEIFKDLSKKEEDEIMENVRLKIIVKSLPSKFQIFIDKSLKKYNSVVEYLKTNIYPYIYSALFSVAFIVLFFTCIIILNFIDLQNPTTDGSVMLTGTRILQLCLYVLAIHCGCVTIGNLIDWSTCNFKTYVYRNPKLFKNNFDEISDLNNITDETAKFRLLWSQRRFFIFYFISVFIALSILTLKMYLGVN